MILVQNVQIVLENEKFIQKILNASFTDAFLHFFFAAVSSHNNLFLRFHGKNKTTKGEEC